MSSLTYAKYETLRTVRNVRFMVFSLVFPLVLLILVGGANRDVDDFLGTGISFPLYYLVGMISWGSMMAVLSGGARISPERQLGWVRQLRLTPLSPTSYLGTKIATGYLLALLTILVLTATAVLALGVRMEATAWLRMVVLVLIGLVPFAALGVWFGHVLSPESIGPVMGGTSALFALLGGAWGPLTGTSGMLHDLTSLTPSYWLVQAGQSAFSGQWWPPKGWLVIAVWTVGAIALAARAYVRDGARV
jgi:ABC-2 type transport system permease protein